MHLRAEFSGLEELHAPLPPTLQTLSVSRTAIGIHGGLPDTLSLCTRLCVLDVSHAQLSALPSLPDSLRELNVAGNALESLPVPLPRALRVLSASGNKLATLNLSGCAQLRSLDVSKNRLESLDLSKCVNLRVVDAKKNKIASVKGIDRVRGLRELCLNGNALRTLPKLPPTLQVLGVSGNRLTVFPTRLPAELHTLHAANNPFKKVPDPLPKGVHL